MTIETIWENIQRWIAMRPFGGDITILHIIIGLVVIFILLNTTRKLVFRSLDKKTLAVKELECAHCGWQGRLQINIRRCPQCNKESMHKRT